MKRRHFIRYTTATAAGASLLPYLPTTSRAASRIMGANDRINLGAIGVRGFGFHDLQSFLRNEEVECVAMADVDRNILEQRAGQVKKIQGTQPEMYDDYRKLLERKDIDAVLIGVPDHWHCLIMVEACQAGKDIYIEKPIGNTIEECNVMLKAANRYERVVQVGQWQRSDPHWMDAVNYVHSGKLGKILTVKAWIYLAWEGEYPPIPDEPVPDGVDYDFWLGPAPKRPFNNYRFHFTWRWFWDYAGGMMSDWGVHLLDYALYGMDQYVPNSVMSSGGKFAFPDDVREVPDTQYTLYEFDDFGLSWETTVGIGMGNFGRRLGVAFIGRNGTLVVNREGWEVIPENYKDNPTVEPVPWTLRDNSAGSGVDHHVRNFLQCLKTREKPNANIDIAAHIARFSHMGNIAYRTGRKLYWNPEKQQFIDDEKANQLVKAHYRAPWKLPVV